MSFHNRVALLLVVIFTLLLVIVAMERAAIARGEFEQLYKPATQLNQ